MANADSRPLVAVDIGNTRFKLGVFSAPLAEPLPHPQATHSVGANWSAADLDAFLPLPPSQYAWSIASVSRPGSSRLVEWLQQRGVSEITQLAPADLPLVVEVDHPEQVGMDRLVNVVAANRLRAANKPAIVIDMGTALTLDLISREGAFAGGAILPGIAMSARALHEFTDLLPLVEVHEPPQAVGRNTQDAMRSGLYWGAVGAVRELISHISTLAGEPEVFLTGGAGPLFAGVLADESHSPPQFIPHLTLAGIAIASTAAPKRSSAP